MQRARLTPLTESSMSVLPFFTLSWGATPASPRWRDRCSVCGWVRVRSLTCASHVRIRKKPRLLPCVTFCYISSCCAARVTRSVDPGVNIRRHPPPQEETMNLLKSLLLCLFHLYYSPIYFERSASLVACVYIYLYIHARVMVGLNIKYKTRL